MQYNGRSSVVHFVGFLHFEFGSTRTTPMHCFCSLFVGLGDDLHLVRHHEGRVETQTEVTDNRLVLVFFHELFGARECDLVDVAVDFIGCHADTAVGYGQRLFLLVDGDMDREVAQFALDFAERRKGFQLLGSIYGIGNQLTQKDFVIRVEEFLDYGEDVFRRNSDFSVFHGCVSGLL